MSDPRLPGRRHGDSDEKKSLVFKYSKDELKKELERENIPFTQSVLAEYEFAYEFCKLGELKEGVSDLKKITNSVSNKSYVITYAFYQIAKANKKNEQLEILKNRLKKLKSI
ncbi:MAG: hypothetical protein IPQ05_20490 [Leptospiraceae bacterium]|nr:hypothetical protein [Leptospiraceae bacterium]